jgi:hypothetical protein
VNWSGLVAVPPGRTTPLMLVFGAGFVGRFTVTGVMVEVPGSVTSVPPVIVVEPDTVLAPVAGFVSMAVQVLEIWVAVRFSCPDALTLLIVDVLWTAPFGPSVPSVWTAIEPELKIVATSAVAEPVGAFASWGLLDASGARFTIGVGPTSGCGPKILRLKA